MMVLNRVKIHIDDSQRHCQQLDFFGQRGHFRTKRLLGGMAFNLISKSYPTKIIRMIIIPPLFGFSHWVQVNHLYHTPQNHTYDNHSTILVNAHRVQVS